MLPYCSYAAWLGAPALTDVIALVYKYKVLKCWDIG
jgi:hypothetical protein